jgi:glycerol-3-phosphate dehydrogenase
VWTHREALPGGDLGGEGVDRLVQQLRREHPYLSDALARRLSRSYGSRAWSILGDAKRIEDLGGRIVANLHQAELDYLRRDEWAVSAEDILWRRTKLGLVASENEVESLHAALASGAAAERIAG